jgi:hypothetical protein
MALVVQGLLAARSRADGAFEGTPRALPTVPTQYVSAVWLAEQSTAGAVVETSSSTAAL